MSTAVMPGAVPALAPMDQVPALEAKGDAAATGIHSPPTSTSALNNDASDSELSDIEENGDRIPKKSQAAQSEVESNAAQPSTAETEAPVAEDKGETDANDIGEVVPDHWDDEGRVPVFCPTWNQFKDFQVYMTKVNPYGMQSGIVKVIPPKEWLAAQPPLDDIVKTIRLREPIKQEIMGTGGTYRQANILHQRSYILPQWRQLCDQSDHQPPAKRGERRAAVEKPRASTRAKRESTVASDSTPAAKRKPGRPAKRVKIAQSIEKDDDHDRLPTPTSPSSKADKSMAHIKVEQEDDLPTPARSRMGGGGGRGGHVSGGRGGKSTSVNSRRKYARREGSVPIDEAAFEGFDYKMDISEYTPERCAELERAYWKTLTYAPPLYGADMLGSLFDDRTTTWNLGNLPNLLDVLGTKIPGVNTAYLYLGMWKATFAWHLEDVDLYSINYLHFGAPKQWYSISQKDARKFENAMKQIWPADAKACDQFLRHKTFLISPSTLLNNYGVKVNKITHFPGEFVITFPYGYHSGFNMGYNCAEAVNFALPEWLEMGKIAKKCECDLAQDSVWIDVNEIERKLNGIETDYEDSEEEEEEEEEDDTGPVDLPSPPDSSGDVKLKRVPRKRKRADGKSDKSEKRVRIRMKVNREPCCLCSNDIKSLPLLPTDDGRKAHKICAEYTPETEIEDGKVYGLKYIAKDRLDLKCVYCHSRKGAKIQCSRGKCTRSYHATCAAAAGMFVEQGETVAFGEDNTEYKTHGIEFACRFHRVKKDKKAEAAIGEEDETVLAAANMLQKGVIAQFQYPGGKSMFAGVVVENRKSEEMVLIDVLPSGESFEVAYQYLVLPDPSDFQLPKPSVNAIPLPKPSRREDALVTTKRPENDLPRKDDPFTEGTTWAEFNDCKLEKNPYQVKIDFSKERQLMYYLGKTSTEARAQYTADHTKHVHDPKCAFIQPTPPAAKPVSAPQKTYPWSRGVQMPGQMPAPILPPQYAQQRQQGLQGQSAQRSERPYVYKPKTGASTQQSPYGTPNGPQGQYPQEQRPNAVSSSSQSSAPRSYNNTPQSHSTAHARPNGPYATSGHYNPGGSTAYNTPTQGNNYRPAITPTEYRSQHSPPPPQRPNMVTAQFQSPSAFRASFTQTPSAVEFFKKYPYLQKEHNKSPSTYRSPYRVGCLGFQNGYEGDLKAHLAQLAARDPNALKRFYPSANSNYSPGNGNLSSAPANGHSYSNNISANASMNSNSYAANSKISNTNTRPYAPILPPPRPTYGNAAAYYPPSAPKQQTMLPQTQITKPVSATPVWDKKDAGMHPGMRSDTYLGTAGFTGPPNPILPPKHQYPQYSTPPQQRPSAPMPPMKGSNGLGQYQSSPAAQYYSSQSTGQPHVNGRATSDNRPTSQSSASSSHSSGPPPTPQSQNYNTPPQMRTFYADSYHAGSASRQPGTLPPLNGVDILNGPAPMQYGGGSGGQKVEVPQMDVDSTGMRRG